MNRKIQWISLGIAAITAFGLACDKKDDKRTSTATAESGVEGVTNQLALAYPGGLALSVFPTENGTTLLDDSEPKSLKKKHAEAKKVLNGEGNSCLAPAANRFKEEGIETCYQFDQEMIYGKKGDRLVHGTKNGKNGSGEACLVAFARGKVREVESIIERRLGMMQSMLCQAKKDNSGVSLPAVGDTLDLTDALTNSMAGMPADKKPTVTSATVKRLEDDDGRPSYRYEIKYKKGEKSREFYVVHSPKSETDNNEYRGIMWSKSAVNQSGKEPHLSIRYALTGTGTEQKLVGELVRARINPDISANAFDKGLLDLNVNADFTVDASNNNYGRYKDENDAYYNNANEAVEGIMYISFELNLADNSGTTSYWQNPGGNYHENARGMVFKLTNDSEMKGCGTSGAAGTNGSEMSIRKKMKQGADTSLKAAGFYHPFFTNLTSNGPNSTCTFENSDNADYTYKKTCTNSDTNQSEVSYWHKPDTTTAHVDTWVTAQTGTIFTKQCVTLNNGMYKIDTTATTSNAGFDLTNTASDAIDSPDIESALGTVKVD